MMLRGVRGATTIPVDAQEEVLQATGELLERIKEANGFAISDIASVFFSVTSDIKSAFPAVAARSLGWDKVPLLCFQEIDVPDSLRLCIRVLVHINTNKQQEDIRHIYLKGAQVLRQDLINL